MDKINNYVVEDNLMVMTLHALTGRITQAIVQHVTAINSLTPNNYRSIIYYFVTVLTKKIIYIII